MPRFLEIQTEEEGGAVMRCPNCNEGCDCEESYTDYGIEYNRYYCPSCGWYEGHEIDARIDVDREEDRREDVDLKTGNPRTEP
jgi:hypothetical protein